jgi:hypothetical protein
MSGKALWRRGWIPALFSRCVTPDLQFTPLPECFSHAQAPAGARARLFEALALGGGVRGSLDARWGRLRGLRRAVLPARTAKRAQTWAFRRVTERIRRATEGFRGVTNGFCGVTKQVCGGTSGCRGGAQRRRWGHGRFPRGHESDLWGHEWLLSGHERLSWGHERRDFRDEQPAAGVFESGGVGAADPPRVHPG